MTRHRDRDADLVRQRRKLGRRAPRDRRVRRAASPTPAASSRSRAASSCCPTRDGALAGVLFGEAATDGRSDRSRAGKLATACRAGDYRFANPPARRRSWRRSASCSALYRFDRFKADAARRSRACAAATTSTSPSASPRARSPFGRDLVNAPANVLTPSALGARGDAARRASIGAEYESDRRRRAARRAISRSSTRSARRRPSRRGSSISPGAAPTRRR